MKVSRSSLHFVSKKFQLILMILHVLVIMYLLSFPARFFYSRDPFLENIEQQKNAMELYKNNIQPLKNQVFVTFLLEDFLDSDMHKGTSKIDLFMRVRYNKKNIHSDEFKELSSLCGSIKKLQMVHRNELENDIIEETWRILFYGSFDLDYALFPFNDHVLNFAFVLPKNFDIKIYHDGLVFNKGDDLNGWKIHNGSLLYEGQDFLGHKCWISVAMSKTGYRHAMAILLPLYLLLLMILFTLSFDSTKAFGATLSLILAINSFRIFLENISPKAAYLFFSDIFFLIILSVAFMILIMHLFYKEIHLWLKYVLLLTAHIFTVGFFVYHLMPWIKIS